MRLNKYISHNSKYSRREADKLIEAGEVMVNKQKVEERVTKSPLEGFM